MSLTGTQLGNYQLLRPIGSGGMGEVYLAEDTRIHRQVAIKVIREEATPYPDANATKEAARLFQREMKAISQLDHPHILPLFDFGEENVNRAKLTYMVMPLRQEGSLTDWLQEHSSTEMLSPQDVAHFVEQAADALQHAHDHQLIHQDVKPSNFLIRSRSANPSHPDLLLADFGIAKFTTATATASQSIRGTPAYMAPEQWDGQPVTATDQYALAVMTYQLLTGRPPFLGGPGQVMRQHFQAQAQPPSTLNPRISSALDAVILRALEKQPADRFASIAEFAHAFSQAVQDAPAASVSSAPSAPPIKEQPRLPTKGNDIRASLAISRDEALGGTSRTLTLSGGRPVAVSVPPRAYDGQIIYLDGLGETSSPGGLAGALILTLAISQDEKPDLTSPGTSIEQTVIGSDPNLQKSLLSSPSPDPSTVLAASPVIQTPNFSAPPSSPLRSGTVASGGSLPSRSSGPRRTIILVIGLVLLLVIASGIFYVTQSGHPSGEPTVHMGTTLSVTVHTPTVGYPSGEPTVHMGTTIFLQRSVTINKGSYLTLIDDIGVPHIITNGFWEGNTQKPAIEPGAPTVNHVFNGNDSAMVGPFSTAGTFHLYCTIHLEMNLTVIVQ